MKKYFLTGLTILLPVTITLFIIFFLVNLLTKPFMGIMTKILYHTKIKDVSFLFFSSNQVIKYGSQVIIILGLLFITILIGYVARWFFVKSVININDKILKKIPIVNKIYKTTKDLLSSLFISDKNTFKQVVMVPFPSKHTYTLGLISKKTPKIEKNENDEEKYSVYIPTTPNPTTGFLLVFEKKDLIFIDMKTEEAIKYIVSCGIVLPQNKKEGIK